MNIIIRADANPAIGMGHIMRTLSVADAFSAAGDSVFFILADDVVSGLVRERGYETVVLGSNHRFMEDELSLWPSVDGVHYIIVDSYYVTRTYLQALHNSVRETGGILVYIDDVLSFPYPVGILINYNAYANLQDYKSLYSGSTVAEPKYILGPTFAPLRSMFRNIYSRVQPEIVRDILISTGGSDELHLALSLIRKLRAKSGEPDEIDEIDASEETTEQLIFHFLIGSMNQDKDEIHELLRGSPNLLIHESVSDMKGLIESVDLAISAAGSTLYEICACGVPLITYSLADNQIPGAEAFEKLGLAVNIGDLRESGSIKLDAVMSGRLRADAVEMIITAVESLADDHEARKIMGSRMQEMIDGFGAERMVKRITEDENPLNAASENTSFNRYPSETSNFQKNILLFILLFTKIRSKLRSKISKKQFCRSTSRRVYGITDQYRGSDIPEGGGAEPHRVQGRMEPRANHPLDCCIRQ